MAHLARNESVNVGSQKTTNVSCFTIQFPGEFTHNESAIAGRTAESLGIKIFKKYVDEQVLANNFEDTSYHSEQHTFDMGQVAKYALSDFVRQQGITVVLSGEGADEHFAGYSFVLPQFLQEPDLSMPNSELAKDDGLREALYRSTSDEAASIWAAQGCDLQESPHNQSPNLSLAVNTWALVAIQPSATEFSPSARGQCFLQSSILTGWGDRTEMAHGVESRPPMMDHHLTEHVNMLPPNPKVGYMPPGQDWFDEIDGFWWKSAGAGLRSHTEKWVMREAVRPFVRDELYRRRKQPFLCPAKWPEGGPLQKMFQQFVTKEAVEELGFVDCATLQSAMGEAFGSDAGPVGIRVLGFVAAWITIGRRFGVKRATEQDSGRKVSGSSS
ncbi:hypothetical protein PWT90_08035 [Aphanocladium album]|nr:hypothetical protein PWT90_08035 [Aphanocladium album]